MAVTAKSAATRRKTLLFKFKDDTVTTVSHETFSQVARKLGFNETQTLHLAIARLRDEVLEAAPHGIVAAEAPYSPLTARQLLEVCSNAPQPRGRLVRRESLF
jgi:hypothetical protein